MKRELFKKLMTPHNFKVAAVAVIVTLLLEFAYVCDCAYEWNIKRIEQMRLGNAVFKENFRLKMQRSREGMLFEDCSTSSMVAAVRSCASNQINNVWYVGSVNGFDCFIHNSDFKTHRFRVPSGKVSASYMMPMTNDVSWWIAVGETPFEVADYLNMFLDGELLHHVAPRGRR